MYIKNANKLLKKDLNEQQSYLRKIALDALQKAISAVKPNNLMKNSIKVQNNILTIQNDEYDLRKYNKIYVIGGGKAATEMAFSLENILFKLINAEYEGIINAPRASIKNELLEKGKIKINFASHPIPDENGLNGTKQMMEIIEKSQINDLILCLISGGGSALLPLPKEGINLKDLQEVNALLLDSGASIHEINIIRKHVSDFKGGNLAKKLYYASGATLISIIISDVVGDKLDSIASGPSVPDTSTFNDAIKILKQYKIYENTPISIINHLKKGTMNDNLENPKDKDVCFNNVHNYIVGSVKNAVKEILSFLELHGFESSYFSNKIVGEARKFGKSLYKIISQKIRESSKTDSHGKFALIGSGELTVTIKGKGIGGRNQEMLLSFLDYIKESGLSYQFSIISANLDGIEGNSKAMGALVDNFVLDQVYKNEINTKKYLENNDSNNFFKLVESEIITGPTGCNVNDLLLVLLQFNK
ncbi:MAG: glycerate kinase [Promethearchaeota archaeon]